MEIEMANFGQRVERVKEFAKEYAENDKGWKVVLEMEDREIYEIVKQTQSPEGAIRKIARMIGSEHGARIELPAPARIQSMDEAERKLLALAGTEGSGERPYGDASEHHASAAELRSAEARRAIRSAAGHTVHHEENPEVQPEAEAAGAGAKGTTTPKDGEKATDKK
jgi:hypothetical protein